MFCAAADEQRRDQLPSLVRHQRNAIALLCAQHRGYASCTPMTMALMSSTVIAAIDSGRISASPAP